MQVSEIAGAIAGLRQRAPLIHNITNYVVMNLTANALLAIGASPAMVHAEEEAGEFAGIANALVINIGTLSAPWLAAMTAAAGAAAGRSVPWVLDPVAVGATAYRSAAAAQLLALRPTVVRGNASEIMALSGMQGIKPRGVDSAAGSAEALEAARDLAARTGTVVAVTGPVDYVTDGRYMAGIANGHVMLTRVTGTGCTATALIGAFLGSGLPALPAAVAGLLAIGIAGEIAASGSTAPGSFAVALIDALYQLDDATLMRRANLT